MPATTTTTAKVVETVTGSAFRTRVQILLLKVATERIVKVGSDGLTAEILRQPERYVATIALLCAGKPEIQEAINEANDLERAFWPTDEMIESVINGAWTALAGV